MILQGRNLTQGLTGPDVATLHAELAQLGYTVPPTEVQANQFGAGTLAVVEQAQAAAGLTTSGTVDAATASALDMLVRASTFAVSGHVTSTVSAGTGGLSVRLVDKNVGGDIVLAAATTDTTGGYSISVVIGVPTLRSRFKTAPDLQAQVIEPGNNAAGTSVAVAAVTIVAASAVAIGASSPLVLDIGLPAGAPGLPRRIRNPDHQSRADLRRAAEGSEGERHHPGCHLSRRQIRAGTPGRWRWRHWRISSRH